MSVVQDSSGEHPTVCFSSISVRPGCSAGLHEQRNLQPVPGRRLNHLLCNSLTSVELHQDLLLLAQAALGAQHLSFITNLLPPKRFY